MAISPQLLTLIVLSQNYRGGIVNQANRQAVALKLLPWKEGEGKNCAFVAKGSGVTAEMFLEGAAVTNASSDTQTAAILPWAMGRANFSVSGLAKSAARTSTTPEGNLELWARNMIDGSAALASLLNGQLYTGDGNAPNMVGLDQAIGDDANFYAGIDRSQGANALFRPKLFNDAGPAAALTIDQIQGDLAAIYIACGARPDVALVHPNVYKKVAQLFQPQKFYMVATNVMEIFTSRGKVALEGGPGALSFDGCYFVEDKDATDGCIYYVSTPHTRIEYLPADLSEIPGIMDESMTLQADDGFGTTPLGMQLEMIAKLGDSDTCMMKSYLQLVVERPNACGKRSHIL